MTGKAKKVSTIKTGRRVGLFKNNIRFYILVFTFLWSFLALCYMRTAVDSNSLYLIRLQQIYGFSALVFWYLALIATPLSKVFGSKGAMRHYLFSRRALGVSAAYLASLHMLVSVFGQLHGIAGLKLLPARFQLSLLLGVMGLTILLVMAFTSFDKVIDWMTFPRWKWIHRFVYIAAILVFLHIWMIGTHMTYPWLRWTFFYALVLLASLESWRGALQIKKKFTGVTTLALLILFITFFTWSVVFIAYLPKWVDGYHQTHVGHEGH